MECSGVEATWKSLINHQRMGGRHLEAEDLSGTEEALPTRCHVLSLQEGWLPASSSLPWR